MGRQVLAGVTLAVTALLAGCGQTSSTGPTTPGTPSTAAPSTSVAAAGANSLAARTVKAACGTPVPAAVTTVIPGATSIYVAKNALGSNCQWSSADYAHRIIAYAITSMPYRNWQSMQRLSGETQVSGYPAVRGQADGGCVIVVNVQNVAFEIDLRGIADPTCQTTTTLATRLLTGTS